MMTIVMLDSPKAAGALLPPFGEEKATETPANNAPQAEAHDFSSPTAAFEALGVTSPALLDAITKMGFTTPTSIQKEAIPVILGGRDIIGQAQTGSGKTGAFAMPLIQTLQPFLKEVQGLILCPTRELVLQVAEQCKQLLGNQKGVSVVCVYGGEDIRHQLRLLKQTPSLVVGTPGRTMDLIDRGALDLSTVEKVVLDEADEMLDMGFREDMETILGNIPTEQRQTILFSATMAPQILKLAQQFQKNPVVIDVSQQKRSMPKIEQFYSVVRDYQKAEVLFRLLAFYGITRGVVFCNTKAKVDELLSFLRDKGFRADALHGDMNQNARTRVMQGFRAGHVEILVATDVAGRGLDVNDLEAVFNFDLPRDDEDYIHRIGRTGRAGKEGKAFTLVNGRQVGVLKRIVRINQGTIEPHAVPAAESIQKAGLALVGKQLEEILANDEKDALLLPYHNYLKQFVGGEVGLAEVTAALLRQVHLQRQWSVDEAMDGTFEDHRDNHGGGGYEGGGGGARRSYGGGGGGGYRGGNNRGGGSSYGGGGGGYRGGNREGGTSYGGGGGQSRAPYGERAQHNSGGYQQRTGGGSREGGGGSSYSGGNSYRPKAK
jgi:ATP-dependent RNA helicase DeaD